MNKSKKKKGVATPAKHSVAPSQRASAKIHGTDEQFRRLINSVRDYAIYMVDPNGKILTWNAGAQRLKGYRAEEIIGKNFACFYTAEDVAAKKPEHNLEQAKLKGEIHDSGLRVRKDGSQFQADVLLTVVRDDSGKLIGYSKVTRDITEQVRARSAEAARLAAEKANKAKDEFLAALSHELRTPLTPVLAAAGYLANNSTRIPKEFGRELDTIQRNVKLQARLIDDLLDLTRVARGKIELRFDRVDAHSAVREALDIARAEIVEKQLKVSITLSARKHNIWADRVRILQVFWNLVNNAVKFSTIGGKIDIRSSIDNRNHFEFSIIDSGIGIEPERQRTLFKPFEQGDASGSRQFGGLGLGLTISKHLVELHDGTITVESRGRSHGATFRVILPILEEQAGESGVAARTPSKTTKSLRILLVEDHGDTRRTLGRLLRHFGHDISEADSTQRAFEIIRSQAFDVILSDIGLPDGSGYEVISQAKQKQSVKGVALSGFGSDEDIRRGREAGFDYHLTKPVDFHELRSVLDQVGL